MINLDNNVGKMMSFLDDAGLSDNTLLIYMTDNGAGMPDAVKDRLFTRFFSTKRSHGTGLGLPVVKKVAEEHAVEHVVVGSFIRAGDIIKADRGPVAGDHARLAFTKGHRLVIASLRLAENKEEETFKRG